MITREEMVKGVRASLDRDPRTRRDAIDVRVSDGVAMLHGEVHDLAAKRLAVESARRVQGVRSIVDALRVASSARPGDGAIRDAVIDALVAANRQLNATILALESGHVETLQRIDTDAGGEIRVRVDDAVVTLEGQVVSLSHRRIAGVLAWWAPGVASVANELAVVPDERDGDDEIVEALRLVLEMDAQVDAAQLTAQSRDAAVTLHGYVRTDRERQRAELDAWALYGVRDVVNRIELQS
jgi:osmotically-inducible protein OsmY